VVLVLVGTFEVVMRYVFNAPTIWGFETSIMLGGGLYALGWAYDYLHDSHVRVDIFYSRFSPRAKAISDLICTAIFFFPLMVMLSKAAISWAWRSWAIGEVMSQSYWFPPAAPSRTVLAVGVCLFTLQGLARFIRDAYLAIRGTSLD